MNQLRTGLQGAMNRDRLLRTAVALVEVPSPTGQAGAVLDRAAELLAADGFQVERAAAGHSTAPAVIVRFNSGKPGRTLQFNGHLDTVHLPFVPAKVDGDLLTGSGASDMKSGAAAAIEAVQMLRDTGALTAGQVLLTLHDLHEAPWGLGEQLDQMIKDGIVGDAVLLPEPMNEHLPVAGRGAATWKVFIRRKGQPVHEVMRPAKEPSVIAAGAELVLQLSHLQNELSKTIDPVAGSASVFIGQFHSGEIYNQFPQECLVEGTRRWLPGTARATVEAEFRGLVEKLAQRTRTQITTEFRFIRDAFYLNQNDPLVPVFQSAYQSVTGTSLPTGPKPFVDDGNSFWGLAGIPAITHGPRAGGQHTVSEWVSIADLERVALVYALTAANYCCGVEP
jgi:acetylornithine deacetylase/succinyl-diaminopimelate desuccinylase-like protein